MDEPTYCVPQTGTVTVQPMPGLKPIVLRVPSAGQALRWPRLARRLELLLELIQTSYHSDDWPGLDELVDAAAQQDLDTAQAELTRRLVAIDGRVCRDAMIVLPHEICVYFLAFFQALSLGADQKKSLRSESAQASPALAPVPPETAETARPSAATAHSGPSPEANGRGSMIPASPIPAPFSALQTG